MLNVQKSQGSAGSRLLLRIIGVTGLSLIPGMAFALSTQVTWLMLDPKLQIAYVDVDADLGYPIGVKSLVVSVNCRSSQVKVFEDMKTKMPIDPAKWKPDATIFNALQSGGVLLQKGGATFLTNPKTRERLALICTGGVLSADYSGMKNIGSEFNPDAPFFRNTEKSEIDMNYALSLHTNTNLSNYSVQVRVQPKAGGIVLTQLRFGPDLFNWAAKAQVFLSDGQYLYPIFYSGQQQTNGRVSGLVLKNQVQFFSSDDPEKGGWRKTTYDYKTQVLTTVPVSKPVMPLRQ